VLSSLKKLPTWNIKFTKISLKQVESLGNSGERLFEETT
jgi:hypothetical protein